jgi:predicted amidohydrolase YtcJ
MLTNDGSADSHAPKRFVSTPKAPAWFSFDDHHVGSFVPGKYADLAVLNQDYLTVTDQAIRKTESAMTIVGGNIVHATGPFNTLGA